MVHIRYIHQYINFVTFCILLLFLTGCVSDNRTVSEAGNTNEQRTEGFEQMSTSLEKTENIAEYSYFNHKISIDENEKFVYAIDNASHMLISIEKETDKVSYLCGVEDCKHKENSACAAYVDSDSNLSPDVWLFQDKIYFISGKTQYALECFDLISKKREKVFTIESNHITDFYFNEGSLFYIQKEESNDYQLIKNDISGNSEAVAWIERLPEHLTIKDSSFYFLSEGKLCIGTFSKTDVKEIAENVFDYDIGIGYIYYSVSGEGIWQYDLLTEKTEFFSDMELRSGYDFAVFAFGAHVIVYNTKVGLYYMDDNGKNLNHVNVMKFDYFYNMGITENYFVYIGHSAEMEISYIHLNELETAENFTVCR